MKTVRPTNVALALVAAALACKGSDDKSASSAAPIVATQPDPWVGAGGAEDEGKVAAETVRFDNAPPPAAPTIVGRARDPKMDADKPGDAKDLGGQKNKANRPEGPTRAWFPETFLFEPLVVTDDNGAATVPVRVPDRLTTWRVLALGHSRTGAQGGALTSFIGTLPTYVDLVVPPTLVIGDEVRLPVQLVNTTTAAVATSLAIEAEGATVTGGSGVHTIPAQGSLVQYINLRADRAGTIKLRAELGDADAVLRTIDVVPAGRLVRVVRTGTLAAPRNLTIEGPAGSDPATSQAHLLVFPGALALLRTELAVSTARTGVADDAYALLLAGRAPALLGALGDTPDPEALRTLSILTGQRAIRHGRTLDVESASLLAEAALAHGDNPVLTRLGERAAGYLAQNQRPDGTFAGETGWTLQRVLVATADAARAVAAADATSAGRQRALGVAARASGAFERNADQVQDGYTAAAILASGAVSGALADKLRGRVLDAIKDLDDGAKYLTVGEGVVRTDGTVPSRAEATAFAALALAGEPKAPVADLGATLLGSYDPGRGWGDGRANLACIQAVLAVFKDPVPDSVKVGLTMDGSPIAAGALDRDRVREVMVLDGAAPALAGSHAWNLTAEPAIPGLGYSLTLEAWVPWDKQTAQGGLELALPATMTATVGKPATIELTARAPSGMALHLRQSLPAGVQVDTPTLQALVTAGTIERFETSDGVVELFVSPLEPGQTFAAKYRVIPTLAGSLHTSASLIEAGTTTVHVPPTTWTVR